MFCDSAGQADLCGNRANIEEILGDRESWRLVVGDIADAALVMAGGWGVTIVV